MGFDLTEILILIIILIFSIVAGIFSAAIYRRTSRGIRYRNLDRARNLYSNKVGKYLDSGNIQTTISELASRANTTEWHAMEEVLLDMMEQANHADKIKVLLLELGYVDYYERRLGKNNIIKRASAIYKLGKMRCERSTWKLIPYLKDGNPEIVTVTIRSLSKIGMPIGLVSILDEIPNILTKPLSSKKTLENSIANFGAVSIPYLVEYGGKYTDPLCKSLALDILSTLKATEAVPLALSCMSDQDPEVRAKSLKVICTAGNDLKISDTCRVMDLLSDPAWFVRLQAAKTLGSLRNEKTADKLGDALLDSNWQVRNAAATALTKFGNRSLHIFLGTLLYKDRYAKESICEEIQRTGFIDALLENMNSKDMCVYRKSRQILQIMSSLNYSTPLSEYIDTGPDDNIKGELDVIIHQDHPPAP